MHRILGDDGIKHPRFLPICEEPKGANCRAVLGFSTTMDAFSFNIITITSATVAVFLSRCDTDPFSLSSGAVTIAVSSLTINIGANVVAPARVIENLWKRG